MPCWKGGSGEAIALDRLGQWAGEQLALCRRFGGGEARHGWLPDGHPLGEPRWVISYRLFGRTLGQWGGGGTASPQMAFLDDRGLWGLHYFFRLELAGPGVDPTGAGTACGPLCSRECRAGLDRGLAGPIMGDEVQEEARNSVVSRLMMENAIQYFNRARAQIETEAIYGEGFLRWAYGNPLGRMTVELAVKRSWFSRWYGWQMSRRSSRGRILPFIDTYGLDSSEFAEPVDAYESFNAFFYRKLRPEARPVVSDPRIAVFPADGRHLALPDIDAVETFYIKGQRFDRGSFLADPLLAETFKGGAMLISRLCPVDYHRYHFPVSGVADAPVLINGPLYSVSPLALRRKLAILWANKRVRTRIESPVFGTVLVLEIGATCVGSIQGTFSPGRVEKGQEKGYFAFGGSCVVTLFQAGRIQFDSDLVEHSAQATELYARMGEHCGRACH